MVACLDCLKMETLAQGGRGINTIGDELMAVFDTAAQAIHAANGMHARFEKATGASAGIEHGNRTHMRHKLRPNSLPQIESEEFNAVVRAAVGELSLVAVLDGHKLVTPLTAQTKKPPRGDLIFTATT